MDLNQTQNMNFELKYPIYVALDIAVSVLATIGNLVVIIIFLSDKNSKSRMHFYILSLSCADLLSGIAGIPVGLLIQQNIIKGQFQCLCSISIVMIPFSISKLSILAISIDRYWAIVYPLSYYRKARKSPPTISIFLCWSFGIILGILPFLGWRNEILQSHDNSCSFSNIKSTSYFLFRSITITVVPLISMAFIYSIIYVKIRQINKQRDLKRDISVQEEASFGDTLQSSQTREIKITWNISTIVLLFVVCWIPLNLLNLIENMYGITDKTLLLTFVILSHSNSAINPFLYSFKIESLKNYLKNILGVK